MLGVALGIAACAPTSTTTTAPVTTAGETSTSLVDTTPGTTTPLGTTQPPPPQLPPLPDVGDGTVCDFYTEARSSGNVEPADLTEISGLAAGSDGALWVHNDSGTAPQLHALQPDGSRTAVVTLDGVFPIDWEDLDIGPGPGGEPHLFVGDIGDNLNFRPWISVFRLAEPASTGDITVAADELELVYPVDDSPDAEAMAVDPVTGDILVVTKDASDTVVYRAAVDTLDEDKIPLERIAQLDLDREITAAAFSPNGDRLVLRGYRDVFVWLRTDIDLAVVLDGSPCAAPSPDEIQGEALAVLDDGTYVTISEGSNPLINFVTAREPG